MTHSCVPWLVFMRSAACLSSVCHVCHNSFVCDMSIRVPPSYVTYIFVCDMRIRDIWLLHMWHSYVTYEGVICHEYSCHIRICMSHIPRTYEYSWHMTPSYVTCIFICAMTHLLVLCLVLKRWAASVSRVYHLCHDSCICDMTHSCVPWLVFMRSAACLSRVGHVCHNPFMCETT